MRAVVASLASAVSTSMGKVNQQPGTPTPTPIPPFFPLACFSPAFSLITPLLCCWENRRILFYLRLKQFFVWSSLTLLLLIKQTCREILTPLSFPVGRNAARSMQWCSGATMQRPLVANNRENNCQQKTCKQRHEWKVFFGCCSRVFFVSKIQTRKHFYPHFNNKNNVCFYSKRGSTRRLKYPTVLCGHCMFCVVQSWSSNIRSRSSV